MDGYTNTQLQTLVWEESFRVLQKTVYGIVPRLRTKFRDLTGRAPNRSWFYEQAAAKGDLPHLNIYGRFLFLLALLASVRPKRAELLMRHAESVFRWFRAIDNPFQPRVSQRPVWDIVLEIEALLIKVRNSLVKRSGEAGALVLDFQTLADELLVAGRCRQDSRLRWRLEMF